MLDLTPTKTITEVFNVPGSTARRWRSAGPPKHVREFLEQFNWLPAPFDGWAIKDGLLWTPEGDSYSPGQVRSITLFQQLSNEITKMRNAPAQYYLDGFGK